MQMKTVSITHVFLALDDNLPLARNSFKTSTNTWRLICRQFQFLLIDMNSVEHTE